MRAVRWNKFRSSFILPFERLTAALHVTFSTNFSPPRRRLSSIGKMDTRIYRPREVSPEDTGVRFCPREAHGILKVWPLRRGLCEFCVKCTMRTRERRIAPSDDPSAEYRSCHRRNTIATVPKVSTTITSMRKHVGPPRSCYNHFNRGSRINGNK